MQVRVGILPSPSPPPASMLHPHTFSTPYFTHPLNTLLTHPLITLLTHPLNTLLTHPLNTLLSTHVLNTLLTHLLNTLLTRPFNTLLTHPLNTLLTHPLNTLLTHPLNTLLTHPFNTLLSHPLNTLLTHPLNTLLTHPLNKLLTRPLNTLLTPSQYPTTQCQYLLPLASAGEICGLCPRAQWHNHLFSPPQDIRITNTTTTTPTAPGTSSHLPTRQSPLSERQPRSLHRSPALPLDPLTPVGAFRSLWHR